MFALRDALVVVDDFGDDEPQELLGEDRVEARLLGERRGAGRSGSRSRLGIGRRQLDGGLVAADRLGDLEALGEQVDERGVDVVDARPVVGQLRDRPSARSSPRR